MSDSIVSATGDRSGSGEQPTITYVPSSQLWTGFALRVAELIRDVGARSIGELGGGANPTLDLADRVGHKVDLTVVDISPTELAHNPPEVETLCVDLCAAEPPVRNRFDLVFSRMLCEHVNSGRTFHGNCYAALRPGGHAMHFYPAATALPFMANRVLPSSLTEELLERVFPARKRGGKHGKFPARYSWCWGPTAFQLDRYRSVGFEVVSCEVGIGHGYYEHIPALRALERAKSKFVLEHASPWLAAYALFVLRRPAG